MNACLKRRVEIALRLPVGSIVGMHGGGALLVRDAAGLFHLVTIEDFRRALARLQS